MPTKTAISTHLDEFRPILKEIKIASSKYCSNESIDLNSFPIIRKKYNLQRSVLRVIYKDFDNPAIAGFFFAQESKNGSTAFNIVLSNKFMAKSSDLKSHPSKRDIIIHRKILAVHEFVHMIVNILARHNNSFDKNHMEIQIFTDTFFTSKELQGTDHYDMPYNSKDHLDRIDKSNSKHFRYSDSDLAADYGELYTNLLLSIETIDPYLDLNNILKKYLSSKEKNFNSLAEKINDGIIKISDKKFLEPSFTRKRINSELRRKLELSYSTYIK